MAKFLLLLLAVVTGSLQGVARAGELLAKPASVPFTQDRGEILVHVNPDLRNLCSGTFVNIRDENGLVESKTGLGSIAQSHIDRFGLQWERVRISIRSLPLGATRLKVSVCGASVVTKARS